MDEIREPVDDLFVVVGADGLLCDLADDEGMAEVMCSGCEHGHEEPHRVVRYRRAAAPSPERAGAAAPGVPDAPARVWAVYYGNYEPSEILSVWFTEQQARDEATRLGGMHEVDYFDVRGAAPGVVPPDAVDLLREARTALYYAGDHGTLVGRIDAALAACSPPPATPGESGR